jgi:citrate synthase
MAALTRMLDDAGREGPEAATRAWLDRDGAIPGFGHPLYPNGDIRALALGEMRKPDTLMRELAEHVREATGHLPNLDFALVALVRGAGLPADAPFILFLLGRSVGWAAHAMERALEGRLIRPRAGYGGPLPLA